MTYRRPSILDRTPHGPAPAIALGKEDARAATPRPISTTRLSPVTPPAGSRIRKAGVDTPAAPAPALTAQKSGVTKRTPFRKRLAAILAVLAVPALAAPGDFGALAGNAPVEGADTASGLTDGQAMIFEQPGMSFPGSAFYYLADAPDEALAALPINDAYKVGADKGRTARSLIDAGPAARPFVSGVNGFRRARDCLAQAVWYEAASESEAGQRAVAQVVLNRVAHPSWPASVCGVVYEGSELSTGCQFSFSCDGSLSRPARGAAWDKAVQIAQRALAGEVYAPVGLATHYHTLWVDPYWADSLTPIGILGAHRFYRSRGSAGRRPAFTSVYRGFEPDVSSVNGARPVPQSATPLPTIQAQPTLEKGLSADTTTADQTDAAIPSKPAGPAYGTAGQAREAFAQAGQWKVDPATLDLNKSASDRPEASAKPHSDEQPKAP